MGTTNPFVGNVFLEVGGGGSPEAYTRACEITGISGLGETNDLVDVTTFCSKGNREYIGGLADGQEMTLDGNFIVNSDVRRRIIAAAKSKQNLSFRVVVDDNADEVIDLTFWFRAAVLSWVLSPSIDNKNAIQFTLKISGEIDITEP